MKQTACALLAAAALGSADVAADLVDQLPGFPKAPFKVYSGYLEVPGPFNLTKYSKLRIHYQLHQSQGSQDDPVVTWHQGGPGGSSMYGGYTEMGYFQFGNEKGQFVNPHAWNKRAHMLYLESPAGSSNPIGFSECFVDNVLSPLCTWDDKTQAEAYAHTLRAFYKAFPELAKNDLYLTGESYAGQYIPNIATYILAHARELPLKGIAVGNGCWGGSETRVECNGPHSMRNDVDLFYGKAMISKKLRDNIYKKCGYDGGLPRPECPVLLGEMDVAVGPHNVYNVYDNCPGAAQWSAASGKSTTWLKNELRNAMNDQTAVDNLRALGGGYDWACGGSDLMARWFKREDVQKAMHLDRPERSRFSYRRSGPASVLLYPALAKQIRVLIYNGDADACVPMQGNQEWTTGLAAKGDIVEDKAWHPWFASSDAPVAAGYATTYTVPGAPGLDFSFVTIRLAGHMVPTFQPGAAFAMFDKFMSKQSF